MKQPEMKSGSQYSGNEQGIALLTVMLLLLILTVLGVAAITTTSLEIRMAQYSSSTEGAAAAAESCTGTGVNIISQTLNLGAVPTQYVVGGAGATSPVIPTSAETIASPPTLTQEIFSQADNNGDVPTGPSAKPDLSFAVGPYTVAGDIDHMYNTQQSGAGLQFSGGYNGIGQGGGGDTQSIYRIDCVATNVATGTTNEVQAVYACLRMAGGCQKKSF